MSPDAQNLWNWIDGVIRDPQKTNYCRPGTNSGPTYAQNVNEPVALEVVNDMFGGFGPGHAIYATINGQRCKLYAMKPLQKPDKVRGWTMNFWMRYPESHGVLRVNLHVHLRMAERIAPVADASGFTQVNNKRKRIRRNYQVQY